MYRNFINVFGCFLFFSLLSGNHAQTINTPPAAYNFSAQKGLHHRRVTPQSFSTNAPSVKDGSSTNSGFIHFEAGLHYMDDNGQLQEARELIEPFANGAIAQHTAIPVIFSPDINANGAIDILTPDKKRIRATPLGLSYYDAATGESVLIAEVRSASAKIIPPNKVVYENFLDDVSADALYEVTKSGVMQMIVIKESIAPPSSYGLSDDTSRLEVITEFSDAPRPAKRDKIIKSEKNPTRRLSMVEPDFYDSELTFGQSLMPRGVAFAVNPHLRDGDPVQRLPVGKTWEEFPGEGRSILFEAVEYSPIKEQLQQLAASSQKPVTRRASLNRHIPDKRIASSVPKSPIQIASADYKPRGFVVDYQIVSAIDRMVFNSGETYVLYGQINIRDVTLQPGCVLKYRPGSSLSVRDTIYSGGTANNPSILTAYDDDSYGVRLPANNGFPGSTGHPSGRYAARALDLYGLIAPIIENVKIRHATIGVHFNGRAVGAAGVHFVRDSSFENCDVAVSVDEVSSTIWNVKLCSVTTPYNVVAGSAPYPISTITDCSGGYQEVPKSSMTASASSYFPSSHPWSGGVNWDPARAINGSLDEPTWHSAPDYYNVPGQWLRLNLTSTKRIGKVKYYPRTSYGGPSNGSFLSYKIFVTMSSSTDPSQWGMPVAEGTWDWSYGNEEKILEFSPKEGNFVIFQCMQGIGGWAAAGEVWAYEAIATPTVAKPVVNPTPGTYNSPLNISIGCTTAGAQIRYTTDGSEPNQTSPGYLDAFQISASGNLIIKAKAFANGMNASETTVAPYTLGTPGGNFVEISKALITADASSYFPASHPWSGGVDWDPSRAIDGVLTTPSWHSGTSSQGSTTEWLRLDLKGNYHVGKVMYSPRYGDNTVNGTYLQYKIYVTTSSSTVQADWGAPVASGTWTWPNNNAKALEFTPKLGRYVIFQCAEGYDGWAAAGEVWAYHVGQTSSADSDNDGLPDNWEMQYFSNLEQIAGGDADDDGLRNSDEFLLSYNPSNPDTGSTGLLDGQKDYDLDRLSNQYELYTANSNPKDAYSLNKLKNFTSAAKDATFLFTAAAGSPNSAHYLAYSVVNVNGQSHLRLRIENTTLGKTYNLYWSPNVTGGPWDEWCIGCPVNSNIDVPISSVGNAFFVAGVGNDTDSDGLADGLEVLIGTNPTIYDMDGDGLSDGWEHHTGYDPNEPDSNENGVPDGAEDEDGDGLANVMELVFGTNPLTPDGTWRTDADSDGIPDLFDPPTAPNSAPELPLNFEKCPVDQPL